MIPALLAGYDPTWTPREAPPSGVRLIPKREAPIPPPRTNPQSLRQSTFDITARTFGTLTVLERDPVKGRGYWWCRCTCGRRVSRTSDFLTKRRARPLVCERGVVHREAT